MEDIKLVCFDLDKTLIRQNSWYELNLALGITHDEDEAMLDAYENGEITYEVWIKKILELYKKHGKADLETVTNVISKCYTYQKEAKEIIEYCKSKGYHVVLISGSIDILVDLVAKDLDIEMAEATHEFVFDGNNKLEDIVILGADKIAKLYHLESFCRKLGIGLHNCVCIGDGDNDIEMFRKTEHGVTFSGSKIEKEAWKVISNLTELKTIL